MDTPRVSSQQSPSFSAGQLIRVRAEGWRIEGMRVFPGCEELRLAGIGRTNRERRITLLLPFDRPQPVDRPALRRITWPRWLHALRAVMAGATPCGCLRSAAKAGIDLHAYQLEPALALLNGFATRLLLADEVGLGKTIQAGIVLCELRAREEATRTLILTPAGLRDQWASELQRRFSMNAVVVDAAVVRRTLVALSAGTNPWSTWPVIIASLDFVKQPEVLRALEPFTWDALLVDEAHQCASAPERSAAVHRLAARARRVLLLTATPHAGDERAFDALCRIGQLDRADRIVLFRRARADVGLPANRRVHLLRVRCTARERRVHSLLDRYTRAVWRSAEATAEARLAMIVLRKRALSSATSLVRSLERRLDALFDVPSPASQLALPFGGHAQPDEQTLEDDEPSGCLGAPGMDGRRERDYLVRLLDAARLVGKAESKIARVLRLLRSARQPALIFTEYRDTARWLAGILQQVGPVVLLHGGLSRVERREAERAFRTGRADILVATDAAGEGLNLHHRCRLVIDLELPWNPMRLEQRIGRIDRLGQTRRAHAIHLVASGTAEEQMVWRLVARQQYARQSVGAVNDVIGVAREDDVAAAVMDAPTPGGAKIGGQRAGTGPFTTIDLRELAAAEVRRLAFVRNAATGGRTMSRKGRHGSIRETATSVALLPRRSAQRSRLASGLVCVLAVRLVNPYQDCLHESIVVLRTDLQAAATLDNGALFDAVMRSPALKQAAIADRHAQLRRATEVHERALAAALARERALSAADVCRASPLQPGMFDRRALIDRHQQDAERAARETERGERLSVLQAGSSGALQAEADVALVLIVP